MSSSSSALNVLLVLLPHSLVIVAQLIMLCACFIYVSRSRSTAGMLMITGNLITLFASMVGLAFTAVMVSGGHPNDPKFIRIYSSVISIAHVAGGFLFAIGLLMMAMRTPQVESGRGGNR
jgi:heme/copper-type cytochrome/quinol oxidase subunit 3